MSDKRRSQRVNYLGTGWLQHKGVQYFCRLENISMHGALVDLKEAPIDPMQFAEKNCLRLHLDAEEPKYRDVMANIARFEAAEAGLEFIEVEGISKEVLESIIKKERDLIDGAHKIVDLAREVAENRGIKLTDVHFDKGEMIPDREIHTLRFFAGADNTSKVHLHRDQIEEFYLNDRALPAHMGVHKAIDRLCLQSQRTSQ